MANNKSTCYIQRVRLVNFHNISNVTIPITPGGHLFLLGDNGSGKTTVLDAIHYALTAGELVELNAAARFGGNKKEGRRINEVISCYNVDTGHRYPDGRVTYVVVELQSPAGSPVSIGLGLSLTDANAPVMKWGFIIDAPLDEIPIVGNDGNGHDYALPREEFKNALEQKNMRSYYRSPDAYANAVARRFFPTMDQYRDYCHFLSICKAYREISSHAGNNYQQLFKQLLPDPELDVFEQLQSSMRNLNESQSALMALEKKYNYIRSLTALLNEISDAKRGRTLYSAMAEHIAEYKLEEECAIRTRSISEAENERKETDSRLAVKKREKQALLHQQENLKSKDASGLLRQEKQIAEDLDSRRLQNKNLSERLAVLKSEQDKDVIQHAELIKGLRSKCEKLAVKLTEISGKLRHLNIHEVLEELNKIIEQDNPARELPLEKLNELSLRILREKETAKARLANDKAQLDAANKIFEEQKRELENLKARKEAEPEIAGYDGLKKELDNAQLDWTPLYLKLHWRPDIGNDIKSAVEEFIGEHVLATVVAQDDSYTMAESILFDEQNNLRIAVRDIDPRPVNPATREWLNQYFDSGRDGKYLDILAVELDAVCPPEFGKRNECRFVSFRSYLMPLLSGRNARLIGEDSRIKEQLRLIAEAEKDLKEIHKNIKEAEEKLRTDNAAFNVLERLDKRFSEIIPEIKNNRDSIADLERTMHGISEKSSTLQAELEQSANNISKLELELKGLQKQIVQMDIQNLEEQLAELGTADLLLDEEISGLNQQIGCFDNQIKQFQTEYSGFCEKIAACRSRKQNFVSELKTVFGLADPLHEIEKIMTAEHVHTVENAQSMVTRKNEEIIGAQATITSRIQEIDGKDFGLRFEKELNQVFSRDNRDVNDLEINYRNDLEQQKQIINKDSSEMFKQIVMTQLREALQRRVFRLEDMARRINGRLSHRKFGDSVYSIHIKAHPKYERLVKMLKNLSVYDQEEADELRAFFESNAEEILSTPPGRIPELLDYRNWYQYDIRVGSGANDGTVISSRVKSVGSGGEQAVPNYLLIMMIGYFLFEQDKASQDYIRINSLLFDEAFYGIDDLRREQLMGFASDLGLQLFIASPNQDGVKAEIPASTTIFVLKDKDYNVHFYPCHWKEKHDMLDDEITEHVHFGEELA